MKLWLGSRILHPRKVQIHICMYVVESKVNIK